MAAPAATRSTVSGSDLASYAQALLRALARDEAMGRRAPRLTEAGQATWQRFSPLAKDIGLLAICAFLALDARNRLRRT